MSKYYDKELPVEVHVTLGERRAGVTYREIEKLKNKNKMLRDSWDDNVLAYYVTKENVEKLIKILKDGK